jgi:hypothetical protein
VSGSVILVRSTKEDAPIDAISLSDVPGWRSKS